MDFKVIFSPLALADLESIVGTVAEQDPQAARRLGNLLLDQAESLAQLPQRGSNVRRRPGVRKLLQPPYLILYRINASGRRVDVLRFWHGARNPSSLRLK